MMSPACKNGWDTLIIGPGRVSWAGEAIIRFVRYGSLSIFAPIFFQVEGEVSISKKVTILM